MRNIFTKSTILAAAGLAMFAMSVPAYAQDRVMRIDIPFSFLAGEQRLPSGTYWVRFDSGFHTVDLTPLTSTETHRIRVHDGFTERKVSGDHRGVLSFLKYGSNLVLKGVYAPGALQRHDLQTSHAEIELAKTTAPAAVGEATLNLQ